MREILKSPEQFTFSPIILSRYLILATVLSACTPTVAKPVLPNDKTNAQATQEVAGQDPEPTTIDLNSPFIMAYKLEVKGTKQNGEPYYASRIEIPNGPHDLLCDRLIEEERQLENFSVRVTRGVLLSDSMKEHPLIKRVIERPILFRDSGDTCK